MDTNYLDKVFDGIGIDFKTSYSPFLRDLIAKDLGDMTRDEIDEFRAILYKQCKFAPKYDDFVVAYDSFSRINNKKYRIKNSDCIWCKGSGFTAYYFYQNKSVINFKCGCNTYDKTKNPKALFFTDEHKKLGRYKHLGFNEMTPDD